MESTNTTTLIR